MTPQEVAVLLQEYGSSRGAGASGGPSDESDLGRAELISDVLATCKEAWSTGSEELDSIAEKLGDGSRDGESSTGLY
jgi:hypothetical protein